MDRYLLTNSYLNITMAVMKYSMICCLLSFLISATGGCSDKKSINSSVLQQLIQESERFHTSDLMIAREDHIIYEMHTDENRLPIETMSITKSFLNLAIGLLIDDGFLKSIDAPLYEIYPEWNQGLKKQITIRHLLNHTSGIKTESHTFDIFNAPNVIRYVLAAELASVPGTDFVYNNTATNLLTDIVKKLSGKSVEVYLTEKIFTPLDIHDIVWKKDPSGNAYGTSGLCMHPQDLLKIGMLLLNEGKWNGKQLISPKWLKESLKPSQPFNPHCGLLWWIREDVHGILGYAAQGYMGQYLVVIPQSKLVAVRLVDARDFGDVMDDSPYVFMNFANLLFQLSE